MPGDLQQPPLIEVGQPLGGARHALSGVAVRADLERVLRLDLEQVGNLAEQACNGEIIHGAGPCP